MSLSSPSELVALGLYDTAAALDLAGVAALDLHLVALAGPHAVAFSANDRPANVSFPR